MYGGLNIDHSLIMHEKISLDVVSNHETVTVYKATCVCVYKPIIWEIFMRGYVHSRWLCAFTVVMWIHSGYVILIKDYMVFMLPLLHVFFIIISAITQTVESV